MTARLLVNASNLQTGGALQVATAFLHALAKDKESPFQTVAILSEPLAARLPPGLASGKLRFVSVGASPSRPIGGLNTRAEIHRIEASFSPTLVFSVFAPTYIKFSARHIAGFAVGWISHATSIAYANHSFLERVTSYARNAYRRMHLDRSADYIVESRLAKAGLCKRIGVDAAKVHIIPNTYSEQIRVKTGEVVRELCDSGLRSSLLVVGADYPHKNYEIVVDALAILQKKRPERRVSVSFTLAPTTRRWEKLYQRARSLGVGGQVRTVGAIGLGELGELYRDSGAVIQPSLFETATAVFPEAMATQTPIIASDLPFARDACGAAAAFFDPLSSTSLAVAMERTLWNESFRKDLLVAAARKLREFPDPAEKYRLQINLLQQLAGLQ